MDAQLLKFRDAASSELSNAPSVGAAAALRGYSIEMIGKDTKGLKETAGLLATSTAVSIAFVSSERNSDRIAAAAIARTLGYRPIPHISARRLAGVSELDSLLAAFVSEGTVRDVFVIAGDLPRPLGPFEDSLALIRSGLLARHGIKTVGVGGYPEGHPSISGDVLWRALQDKLRMLADAGHDSEITTQFTFSAQPVIDWLSRLRDAGIVAPVKMGVPGPATIKALLRFASICGVADSAKVMTKHGLSLRKLLTVTGPDALVSDLAGRLDPAQHGETSLHFYPFGGIRRTAEWLRDFAPGNLSR